MSDASNGWRNIVVAERAYRESVDRTEDIRRHRNKLIREAVAAGDRPADIARALDLTRARVTQIAQQG